MPRKQLAARERSLRDDFENFEDESEEVFNELDLLPRQVNQNEDFEDWTHEKRSCEEFHDEANKGPYKVRIPSLRSGQAPQSPRYVLQFLKIASLRSQRLRRFS